jgi:hypothetical protein
MLAPSSWIPSIAISNMLERQRRERKPSLARQRPRQGRAKAQPDFPGNDDMCGCWSSDKCRFVTGQCRSLQREDIAHTLVANLPLPTSSMRSDTELNL